MDTFRRLLAVNLVGSFHVAQCYAREMGARGGGTIVGVASIAARMPRMRQAAYSASKAGLRQALRVLAMEVAPLGVRINTVSPGATDTPMMRELAHDHQSLDDLALGSSEAMRPRIPHGRVATPEDIAHAVAFLLSPNAEHVHMHDLVVDGGEMLGM
jgi:2,3-dihydro-2,3-dihydroxybenzoate dehydrogenase